MNRKDVNAELIFNAYVAMAKAQIYVGLMDIIREADIDPDPVNAAIDRAFDITDADADKMFGDCTNYWKNCDGVYPEIEDQNDA